MTDEIPCVEYYHGVGIHDGQPRERIERKVKPALDFVFNLDDVPALLNYAGDVSKPPEARQLAGVKLLAMYHIAAEERRVRPDIDPDHVWALFAGLDSQAWRSRRRYCTLMDESPEAELREIPLSEH
ncbi:MAG: hypothetical protein V4527_14930 [Pseudomonadota bacterium]